MQQQQRYMFPLEFQKALVSKGMDYAHLSRAMSHRGYRLSKQFIGQLALGQRRVPPEQLKRICETLELDIPMRRTLARAACLDQGYEI